MLVIKYTPNIFLIRSTSSPSFSKICYVKLKVCVLKNWKQLFLSKLILYLLGQEYGIYFSMVTYIFSRYLRNIHEKKFLDPRKYPPEKIWTHEIITKKSLRPSLDPRNTHNKKLWTHEDTVPRWHGAHETHDGTRLFLIYCCLDLIFCATLTLVCCPSI